MYRCIVSLLLTLFIVVTMRAQNTAAGIPMPAPVLQSFNRSFPGIDSVTWTSAGNVYEATFLQQQKSMYAQLDSCGNLCKYSKKIEFKTLPELVRVSFATERYREYDIAEVYEWNQPNGTPLRYFTIVGQTQHSRVWLNFTPNGYSLTSYKPRCPCLR